MRVAVVGAGWSGCAAAVALAEAGQRVTLFESARSLGGRARAVPFDGYILDNGQHILLGAYARTLDVMRRVGIAPDQVLLRLPLQMPYPTGCDGMNLQAPRLPAPLHVVIGLLRATGLRRADKMSLLRFSSAARWMGWHLHQDCSVAELLERFDQTERLTRLMWRPLCIAALNTPPDRASANVFLAVLRDSLGAGRKASDMLLPRVDLSALFPAKAAEVVTRRGGEVRMGVRINAIETCRHGWNLFTSAAEVAEAYDAVVLATPVLQSAELLRGHVDTSLLENLGHEPITTCYLRYAASLRLARPFYALADDAERSDWGQFVFDRGQLNAADAGWLAVVISASSDAIAQGREALGAAVAQQLAEALQMPALAAPQEIQVVTEKRATFSCTPGLVRPDNDVGLPRLALAGDYTASDYPATLESAVRSGLQAARLVMETAP
ncbi:squalene-associated FAD-dependent desaturase [Noviherbaspirillum humi]|uniref:Squalene-associated FAD-dependent desaturase n=1 Tax=Noviherbaspirillum humi TaxID=1688639 RepID=A0A239G0J3_9BURK|nr:squalene-associated FAD-dependent desaturase [Noviherbaspirillum humi]